MSKEDIKDLYAGLSKSGLKKAEIEQYQKFLLKNAEVPEDSIKGIVKPEVSAIDKAAEETKAIEATKATEIARTVKVEEDAKIVKAARVVEVARDEKVHTKVVSYSIASKLKKYVCPLFEGNSKEIQNNFNKYLRENVWSDETLSNADKIDIMKANFENLTPVQKINFNVLSDVRVIQNKNYSNWGEWPTLDWPSFPGLDTSKEVLGISKENMISQNIDRIGSLSGNNFGIVSEDGHIYTQAERSICYIENQYAYNSFLYFDNENYIKSIDCIKNSDYKMLNNVIDDINLKNGTKIEYVDADIVKVWNKDYLKFQNNDELKVITASKNVDSTYGVIGKAAPWKTADGEVITCGGATQLNTPVSGQTLKILGILK